MPSNEKIKITKEELDSINSVYEVEETDVTPEEKPKEPEPEFLTEAEAEYDTALEQTLDWEDEE